MKSIPQYWMQYLAEKVAKIRRHTEEGADDAFIFISDMHSENNPLLSPSLARYIGEQTGIVRVIIGGDLINGNREKEKALAALDAVLAELAPLRPYIVRGNHDVNTDWGPITPENFFYDAIFRERVMSIAANKCEEDGFYGYADFPEAKMRYFFLDSGARYSECFDTMSDAYDWTDGHTSAYRKQLAYLCEKARELSPDWGIAAVQHIVIGGGLAEEKNRITDIINRPLLDTLDEIAADPTAPTVVAVFCGHNHRDRAIISPTGYPVISLTCDAGGSSAWDWDADYRARTVGTTDEQAFDVVQINRKSRTIHLTRIGVGKDRVCRF